MAIPMVERCPEAARLQALRSRLLPAEESDLLARHVSGCAVCTANLEGAAGPQPPKTQSEDATKPGPPVALALGEGPTGSMRLVEAPGRVLAPGTNVGRYVVLEKLGEGGMGVVYAAYDGELHRKVALKLLKAEAGPPGTGSASQQRLVRESCPRYRASITSRSRPRFW